MSFLGLGASGGAPRGPAEQAAIDQQLDEGKLFAEAEPRIDLLALEAQRLKEGAVRERAKVAAAEEAIRVREEIKFRAADVKKQRGILSSDRDKQKLAFSLTKSVPRTLSEIRTRSSRNRRNLFGF